MRQTRQGALRKRKTPGSWSPPPLEARIGAFQRNKHVLTGDINHHQRKTAQTLPFFLCLLKGCEWALSTGFKPGTNRRRLARNALPTPASLHMRQGSKNSGTTEADTPPLQTNWSRGLWLGRPVPATGAALPRQARGHHDRVATPARVARRGGRQNPLAQRANRPLLSALSVRTPSCVRHGRGRERAHAVPRGSGPACMPASPALTWQGRV